MTQTEKQPMLYAAEVTPLSEPAMFAEACRMVSPQRREKALRFRKAGDQRLCLAAELLLRYGLEKAGISFLPELLRTSAQGKPYLQGDAIHFSLSHSGSWALCAISECTVGCDLEKIRTVSPQLGQRFAQTEYDDLCAQASETDRQMLFFRYWTLKESFMKATGLGMSLPLSSFRIRLEKEISVAQSADGRTYRFQEFNDIPGYCCAVCTEGERTDAALRIVPIQMLLNWDEESISEA